MLIFLKRQVSDFIAYLLLPLLSVILPGAWSIKLARLCAGWEFIFSEPCDVALNEASKYISISNVDTWRAHWRSVELIEARDVFMLTFGRKKTVLNEIKGRERMLEARDNVLIGVHWGSSIAVLRLLKDLGLAPSLVYRDRDSTLLRKRPFNYLYSYLAVKEVLRTCGSRAIRIGGAGQILKQRMSEAGTVLVVLDAPPMPGRRVMHGRVLDRTICLNAGFPEMLVESDKQCRHWAVGLDTNGDLDKTLYLSEPLQTRDPQKFLQDYCDFLDGCMRNDGAQWRIWQAAGGLFSPLEMADMAPARNVGQN
jgi:hypothetical protein